VDLTVEFLGMGFGFVENVVVLGLEQEE